MTEGERLARFSEWVRESSLKRFKQVSPNDRGWRPSAGQLSFADILKHLGDADRWIMAILRKDEQIPSADIKPGDGKPENWAGYLSALESLGKEKAGLLKKMSEAELSKELDDWEAVGKISMWLILMRGNLDHEIHHRGSLQTMLNLKYKALK